jgi:hypothetical protein
MEDIEFGFREQIASMAAKFWDELTVEHVQHIFENGLCVLSGSLQMEKDTPSGKNFFELNYSRDLGRRQGAKTFWTPYNTGQSTICS